MSITIRKSVAEDRERIIEISSKIWEGHDYIPNIVEYWIRGENGILWVAELEGRVQGFSRTSFLRPNTCWMEGIRVDTDARGQGIGKALTAHQIKVAFEMGYEHCELSSFIENYESLSIVEKNGFRRVSAFKVFDWDWTLLGEAGQEAVKSVAAELLEGVIVTPVQPSEIQAVLHLLSESHMLRRKEGYFSFDWTFEHVDEVVIQQLIEAGSLYWLEANDGDEKGLFSLSNRFVKGSYNCLNFISRQSLIPIAAAFAVTQAIALGHLNVGYMAADQSLNKALSALGFRTWNDQSQDVFVYRLNQERDSL